MVILYGDTSASASDEVEFCFNLQGLHHTFIQQVTVTLQGDVHVT